MDSCHFAKLQELACKDIEKAYGVLQARGHILTVGCFLWDKEDVMLVMKWCIILHNILAKLGHSWEERVNNSTEDPHPNDAKLPPDSLPAQEEWRALVKNKFLQVNHARGILSIH